ncbi:phosphate acyltransferase [Kosmotoga arenicorallina S304]|uniref:Phosphate acyltransferase n=1 Tax=Kosmotoga arenicorallina S304 TaxID=1453497 RepID=A0A182C754_9BACT|nr:phosphate acyltransferase PlsX [Kosmotoga arenicorallina]OAA31329.1 phosphate acyltransferase [Kosmotoga arenicorallina S304]
MSGVKIALDVFGGDLAPDVNIDGAISILKEERLDLELYLVGKEEVIKKLLRDRGFTHEKLHVIDAPEIFGMAEKPSAILRKKDTSLYRSAQLVKEGKVDAMVSAGNTGAVLAVALFVVGRIKGVERGAIATPIPSKRGFTVLLDCGANVEVRPEHLRDFGKMGFHYAKLLGKTSPKVGLLNVGEEEEKGTKDTKAAFEMLKETLGDSFCGNVEGRDILYGDVDVVVTDGFKGNVAMKAIEGAAKFIGDVLKSQIKASGFAGILGGLLLKGAFNRLKKTLDPSEYGGAFVLGVKGVVTKAHGNSNTLAIKNAIKVAHEGVKGKLVDKLQKEFGGN